MGPSSEPQRYQPRPRRPTPGAVAAVAATLAARSDGEWCNWQHSRFWFCYSGFDSLLPSQSLGSRREAVRPGARPPGRQLLFGDRVGAAANGHWCGVRRLATARHAAGDASPRSKSVGAAGGSGVRASVVDRVGRGRDRGRSAGTRPAAWPGTQRRQRLIGAARTTGPGAGRRAVALGLAATRTAAAVGLTAIRIAARMTALARLITPVVGCAVCPGRLRVAREARAGRPARCLSRSASRGARSR